MDPLTGFEQMRVLQDALQLILHNDGYVFPDWTTEKAVFSARGISHKDLQAKPLFLWYDFFSVPQHVQPDGSQANAISSIPAYVAKCCFFIALCPTIDCPSEKKVLNSTSWARRGWCRLERAARELSAHDTWILTLGCS